MLLTCFLLLAYCLKTTVRAYKYKDYASFSEIATKQCTALPLADLLLAHIGNLSDVIFTGTILFTYNRTSIWRLLILTGLQILYIN